MKCAAVLRQLEPVLKPRVSAEASRLLVCLASCWLLAGAPLTVAQVWSWIHQLLSGEVVCFRVRCRLLLKRSMQRVSGVALPPAASMGASAGPAADIAANWCVFMLCMAV